MVHYELAIVMNYLELLNKLWYPRAGSAEFFVKGQSKYFGFCEPHRISAAYSSLIYFVAL